MKKLALIAIMAIAVSLVVTSCKSRKGTCPAYSQATKSAHYSKV